MTASQSFEPWLFYGGTVALDFVNTLRDRTATPRETLTSPTALTAWTKAVGLIPTDTEFSAEPTTSEQHYADALALRAAIDAVLIDEAVRQPGHIQLVNAWASLAPCPLLDETDPGTVLTRIATTENVLGAIAADAISIIARGEQSQIKICAHHKCGLRFLDRSRSGQRQWCSMQRCGNRAKAARHATRRTGNT